MRFLASRRTAAAIVLFALVLRLYAGFWWQSRLPAGQSFFFADSQSYWKLGQRISRGPDYEFDSAAHPLFPPRSPMRPTRVSTSC